MRILSFLLSLLGLSTLLLIYLLLPPKTIHSPQDLSSLEENQKVQFTGEITDIREYETDYLIKLNNNLSFYYPRSSPKASTNNTIKVQGSISLYSNKTYINVKKIKIIPLTIDN